MFNIAEFLGRAARVAPTQPAVFVGRACTLTYGALGQRVEALAGGLTRRFGLQAGSRVALFMSNDESYVAALFACWHAGLVCVPINAKLHAKEVAYILDQSGSRVALISPDLAATAQDAARQASQTIEIVETRSADFRQLLSADALPLVARAGDDPAWLFYTSGTTGRSKGATLTHRNLAAMSLSYLSAVDHVGPRDCILHAAPMSHGSGLYAIPYTMAMAAHVVPESGGFDTDEVGALVDAHTGVGFFAAPTMVNRLVSAQAISERGVRNLRNVVYGGGPMYLEDCKRALRAWGPRLTQIYGQGESPMTITVLPQHLHVLPGGAESERRLRSVGFAQPAVEVKVVAADGADAAPGEVGEILVRGDPVMAGYWDNPGATAAAIDKGWLKTGDLGVLDADGFLTLSDRSKDLIISGGSNIYPREVEEVLLRHEAIAEVAVVGRPHSDWGEEVVAVIVPAKGRQVDESELDRLCLDHIARFKRPKSYVVVSALPKNNYGKVLKTELRMLVR